MQEKQPTTQILLFTRFDLSKVSPSQGCISQPANDVVQADVRTCINISAMTGLPHAWHP